MCAERDREREREGSNSAWKVASTFTLGSDLITCAKSAKHLGVVHTSFGYSRRNYNLHWTPEKCKFVKSWASQLWSVISESAILPIDRAVRIVNTVILPQVLYGSEIAPPPAMAQVAVNSVLRVAFRAYRRTPRRILLYLTGIWRVETLARMRRLQALVRWCLPSYQSPEPAAAISLAKEHNLRWWREAKLDLTALRLRGEYSKVLDEIGTLRSLTPDEADERSTALMMHWTRLLKDRLDPRELKWQYQVWPHLKPPKQRTTAMHPVCRAVHGAAALYLFVPSMAPMDVYERRGSVNPPCFLCGEDNGDHMQHMACRCQSPLAVATRLSAVTTFAPCAAAGHEPRPIGRANRLRYHQREGGDKQRQRHRETREMEREWGGGVCGD